MTPEMFTAIMGAGGLAAILPKIIDGFSAWISGRAAVEKGKNQTLIQRLEHAELRAENEAEHRRHLEEYAGALRLLLITAGIASDKLPPWPERT